MKKIYLTQGLFSIVDDEEYKYLNSFKWSANKSGNVFYATRRLLPVSDNLGSIKMHQAIMGKSLYGLEIDHIDGNGLNNLKENLRFVTVRENQQNQKQSKVKKHSKYPGVSRYEVGNFKKWVAGAKVNGKRKTIGYFDLEIDAYNAYMSFVNKVDNMEMITI